MLSISLSNVFSQDRVNRDKLNFEASSGTLLKATGWAYNSTIGEWIDYANVISEDRDYKDKFKSLQGAWMMSRISQNFLNVQTKILTFKETKYYVLIVEKWSGEYAYPAIKEDWYTFKKTIAYIYTEQEFKKLQNIEGLVELKTREVVSMGSKYEKYDETKFLDLIQTELSKEKSKYAAEYTFPIMKSKEGAIRFYLPDYFSTYTKYDFEKEYFETDADSFSKILLN